MGYSCNIIQSVQDCFICECSKFGDAYIDGVISRKDVFMEKFSCLFEGEGILNLFHTRSYYFPGCLHHLFYTYSLWHNSSIPFERVYNLPDSSVIRNVFDTSRSSAYSVDDFLDFLSRKSFFKAYTINRVYETFEIVPIFYFPNSSNDFFRCFCL